VSKGRTLARALAPLFVVVLGLLTTAPSYATIHAGDNLFVKVWNHPELSKQVAVDSNGGISVPLSGVVDVAGLDESQAGKKLAAALRPFIVYPAVNIETIEQGKSLFVSGGPGGVLKYQPGETLAAAISDVMQSAPDNAQALNSAGQSVSRSDSNAANVRARIDLHRVGVERDGATLGTFDTVAFGIDGKTGPALQPGDTIVFNYKPLQVRVMGDVAHPGIAYLAPDQSIAEAITQAGGALPTAASNHVTLTRDGQTRSLALGDPAFSGPAKTGDVVMIPAAPRVNVVGTVVTPGVVSLKTDPSLLSAMYAAGGPTKKANLRDVQIVHAGTAKTYDVTKLTHGDLTQNPQLADGDTVVVPEGHNFDWTGIFGILGGIAAGLASRVPL
jgi:protein involved in polysaccharide export with SLBB domain